LSRCKYCKIYAKGSVDGVPSMNTYFVECLYALQTVVYFSYAILMCVMLYWYLFIFSKVKIVDWRF